MSDLVTVRSISRELSHAAPAAETAKFWWRIHFERHVGTNLTVSFHCIFTGNNPVDWKLRLGGTTYNALDGAVVCSATASAGFSSDTATYANPGVPQWATLTLESTVGMFAGIHRIVVTVRDA